jgi:hypothetical protein
LSFCQSISFTLGRFLEHAHDAVRIGIRQGLQQHAIDKAEDRCVRADAQSQGQNRDRTESGAAAQRPDGISQILPE